VVLTTSAAITLIAFWIYDFMLAGPAASVRWHPAVSDSACVISPGTSVDSTGNLASPAKAAGCERAADDLPGGRFQSPYGAQQPVVIGLATLLNVLIVQ